jgi:hypothetical protein
MSTLVAQTISNGTVSTSSQNVIQGSARAWVNFNGTTATPSTIRASFNVSSITRTSTGIYNVIFTTSMIDTNYTAVASCSSTTFNGFVASTGTHATNLIIVTTVDCGDAASSFENNTVVGVVVFR